MVARRMGSKGGVNGGGGNSIEGGIQTQTQTQTRIETHDPLSNLLSRQGSFYNLTLDEVQSHLGDLGKPLSSMNLDELLKTVFTAESNNNNNNNINQTTDGVDDVHLAMLSADLSKKTVDEVWQDIQHGEERSSLDRTGTLGEMTLEDFLVKAGIVAESSSGRRKTGSGLGRGSGDPTGLAQQAQWMNYQIPSLHPQPVFLPGHQSISLGGGNPMMDVSSPLMGSLSDTQTPGRKRVAPDEIAEKCVERRQKRMIKNRESAARSRARKQAYTHELENKVSRLEEENERLKRQQIIHILHRCRENQFHLNAGLLEERNCMAILLTI